LVKCLVYNDLTLWKDRFGVDLLIKLIGQNKPHTSYGFLAGFFDLGLSYLQKAP